MDRDIVDFIREHRSTDRECHFTHVSCVRPKGRYCFGRDEMEAFWNLYCQKLSELPGMVSGMAEIPQEYSMLVVDADIKKKISDLLLTHPEMKVENKETGEVEYRSVRLYSEEQVQQVIHAYQEVIKTVTKDWQPRHSVCILLEKDPYISDDYVKSGFHLAFINYFCSKALQDTYLIPRVVDRVDAGEIFKDLGYSSSSAVLDISKKYTKAKPWLLYGSCKSETSGTYSVSKAFGDGAVEMSLEEAFRGYRIYTMNEKLIEMEDVEYYYPRIFSINPCHRKTVEIIPAFEDGANIQFTEEKEPRDSEKYDETLEQQLETATRLVEMLDISRAEKRDDWIEIGWILHSISKGTEEGLQIWITFSQQVGEKFSQEVCFREWANMYPGSYTLGSLKHYAKIDSPEAYEEYWKERLEKTIRKSISGSHNDLAKALYESYGTEFVCASLKPEIWFQYKQHHWERIEEAVDLRKKISDDLVHRFNHIIKEEFDALAEADDEDGEQKGSSEKKIGNIYKLIKNLKNASFKNSIMRECREVFYDGQFLKKLGKNKYLIALQNGVYDLKNYIFRPGKPEDYITLQMPVCYREFHEHDEWMIETNLFFEKVFPDRSICEYQLDRLAELFVGGNKRKHIYFWTGRGNNAKSVMKSLIQRMFGDYFIDFPNSIITGPKPKSGQACPELARADNGVRVAITQEPNKGDRVNTGASKEYSGNDSFYTRTLFEKGGEITPMFKLIMIANDLPEVTTNDPAFWNRCRVIPFESTFVDNPPEDEEEQFRTKTFKKDENFEEKIENMLQPLLYMLLSRLPKITRTIHEPPKVRDATERYRRSQDMHFQFISERIIQEEKRSVTTIDYYVAFRAWHRSSFPGGITPTKNDCIEYLSDIWGVPVNNRWTGYRLRTEKDDIADGTAEECQSEASPAPRRKGGNPLSK